MTRFAYRQIVGAGAQLIAFAALAATGCTAGVKASLGGGGMGGSSSGTGGTAAGSTGTGRGGTTGTGGQAGTTPPSDAGACQQMDVKFTAQTPSVFILVDRSGSEFTSMTAGTFFNLRPAVEQVVAQLEGQVRFGLGSFVGDHASGTCMLSYQSVPIALNNSAAIKSAYDGWGPLTPYGAKADTPAVNAIPMAKTALKTDSGNGQKYMMIVTDSETDFCDDGNALCPADAMTYLIQDMYAGTPSIGTLVIGLPASNNIAPAVLQNFANAGVGQPVALPTGSGAATSTDVYYQCNGMTNGGAQSWSSLFTAAGRSGMTSLATYSATGGTAPVFSPSATDTQSLIAQISKALAGVRSCTFDLSQFKIDLTKLAMAEVDLIDTSGNKIVVPLDPNNANGWDMTTQTQLQLYGPACEMLRAMTTADIKFNFPCTIIVG